MAVAMRELRDASQPIIDEVFGARAPRVILACDYVYDTILAIVDGVAFTIFTRQDVGDNWREKMSCKLAVVRNNMDHYGTLR